MAAHVAARDDHRRRLHAGTITFLGSVLIAQGTTRPDAGGNVTGVAYRERCGSRARALIPGVGDAPLNQGDWAANDHALIRTSASGGTLTGYTLPTLDQITFHGPGTGLLLPYVASLTARHLYLVDWSNDAFIAPSPK